MPDGAEENDVRFDQVAPIISDQGVERQAVQHPIGHHDQPGLALYARNRTQQQGKQSLDRCPSPQLSTAHSSNAAGPRSRSAPCQPGARGLRNCGPPPGRRTSAQRARTQAEARRAGDCAEGWRVAPDSREGPRRFDRLGQPPCSVSVRPRRDPQAAVSSPSRRLIESVPTVVRRFASGLHCCQPARVLREPI